MFKLRLLRPLVVGGRRWLRGAEVHCDARTARQLIEEGGAVLADEHDLVRLVELTGAGRRVPVTR